MQRMEAMQDLNNNNNGEGVAAELDIAPLSIGSGHLHPQNNINTTTDTTHNTGSTASKRRSKKDTISFCSSPTSRECLRFATCH